MTRVLAAAGWLLLTAVPLVLTLALCRGAAHGDRPEPARTEEGTP